MVWEPEIEELKQRQGFAARLGGEAGIAEQRRRGKLTVRERIDKLLDKDSFDEIGELAGSGSYEGNKVVDVKPTPVVIGLGEIDGRKVAVDGGDFTNRVESSVGGKSGHLQDVAVNYRLPMIRLLDAPGGSVKTFEKIGRTYAPIHRAAAGIEILLNQSPVVAAALGSVAGLPAVEACLSHFNVMVKGMSQVFPGGPPVVKAALGLDITKEELGDERSQVYDAGVIDNLANSEDEAFDMIRTFLSYLPSNVWEMPPRGDTSDDPKRRDEEMLSIIPRDKKRTYDPRKILDGVFDRDSFFEISPYYGRSRILGLARVHGYPVGAMINNPKHLNGSTDVAAGKKVIRFLQLCDMFHLPIIYMVDEPGFMVGPDQQRQGILRAGAQLWCATLRTRVPYLTVVTRQMYGVAATISDRPYGMFRRVAWPSGHWGSMHISGGVSAAYKRVIAESDDPEAKEREIEERLEALASPYRSAEAFNIEQIIDPRDTRPLVSDFVEMAQPMLKTQLGLSPTVYFP